jgi:hypothetical protein
LKHIASRFASARLVGLATIAAAGGALVLASGGPASADTTVNAPTIAVAWTPSEIGVTDSSGIAYTISNPNSSATLYNVAFTDTLPSFAALDNPTGQTVSSGCGSSPTVGASPGDGADGATGITIKAGAVCTISLSVVGNTVGDGSDTLSPLSYSTSATGATLTAPSANVTTASLDVIAAPTVAVTTPRNHATYTYGERVAAVFTCSAPTDANRSTLTPGSCIATDDLGNVYASGQDLDTKVPGVHTLDVEAGDNDGDSTDTTITYTVLPDNIVTLLDHRAAEHGVLKLKLAAPGAGTLKLTETRGGTTVATRTTKLGRASTALSLGLAPTAAGRKLLTRHARLRVILTVAFTPKGGRLHAFTKVVTLS